MSMKWNPPHEVAKWLVHGTDGVEMGACLAMDAVREFIERDSLHWILVLASSERGSGKSQAAEWLRVRLLELLGAGDRRVAAIRRRASSGLWLWVECASLTALDGLKPWERAEALERMRSCWLLVLDDLGLEPDVEYMRTLLQSRQGDGLLTLVTTNLVDAKGEHAGSHVHFVTRYGGRLSSRLRRTGDVDAGELSAWRHVPHRDMRGRTEPKLKPRAEAIERPAPSTIDELAAPLLRSTSPRLVAEQQEQATRDRRSVDDVAREANRRKVLAGIVLEEVEAAAERGDANARLFLEGARLRIAYADDNEARRAAGSEG
jgi:hypothetical protein